MPAVSGCFSARNMAGQQQRVSPRALPVINLGRLGNKDPAARALVIQDIARACRERGCFQEAATDLSLVTMDQKRGEALSGGRDSETMEEKQAAAESTQTVVVEDREGLARYQQFKWSLNFIGFVLFFGVGYLLYSFLLPGISKYFQIFLWLTSATCFVAAAIFTRELVNEFGWSVPKIGEPNKPETGADLC